MMALVVVAARETMAAWTTTTTTAALARQTHLSKLRRQDGLRDFPLAGATTETALVHDAAGAPAGAGAPAAGAAALNDARRRHRRCHQGRQQSQTVGEGAT